MTFCNVFGAKITPRGYQYYKTKTLKVNFIQCHDFTRKSSSATVYISLCIAMTTTTLIKMVVEDNFILLEINCLSEALTEEK